MKFIFTKKAAQGIICMMCMAFMIPSVSNAQPWKSDPVHSTVMYTIRHSLTPMIGVFRKFQAEMNFDATKPLETTINVTLDVNSVIMGSADLEEHLKNEEFFDAAKFPEWTFKSTSITVNKKSKSKTAYIANGQLTVKGVTKDIAVPFEFLGMKEGTRGTKAGFSAEFTINRLDYGVGQGDYASTEGLGGDVKITVYLDMSRKKQ